MAGRPSLDFVPGTQFGALMVIQKVRTPPGASGGQRYRMQCICGQRITIPRFYFTRKANPKTHCGCQRVEADEPFTKRSWYAMHMRCYYTKHVSYAQYGGRGITVDWRWHKDNPEGWENFKKDMGRRPKNMSLDRIDNNKGYSKDNCKWSTASEQTLNQRHRK